MEGGSLVVYRVVISYCMGEGIVICVYRGRVVVLTMRSILY